MMDNAAAARHFTRFMVGLLDGARTPLWFWEEEAQARRARWRDTLVRTYVQLYRAASVDIGNVRDIGIGG